MPAGNKSCFALSGYFCQVSNPNFSFDSYVYFEVQKMFFFNAEFERAAKISKIAVCYFSIYLLVPVL